MAVNPTTNSISTGVNAGAGILDANGLQRLREAAHDNSPDALKKASSQFEALFLDMVMKSMREATPTEGLMDSEQGKVIQGMLDQQYAKALATRGIGLADVLVRQLTPKGTPAASTADTAISPAGLSGPASTSSPASASSSVLSALTDTAGAWGRRPSASAAVDAAAATPASAGSATAAATEATGKPSVKRSFIAKLMSHAETVSAATGIPSRFMVAHAALESGWGRREIRNADGSNSHNIFGIKAGANWKGKFTEVATTEYVNGVPQKRIERFRAYDSYADAFADYAKTLTNSARYREVVASASDANGFAQGLQKAGYATDPRYAQKLSRVIARV